MENKMPNDLNTLQKYYFILKEFEKRQDKTLSGYDEVLKEELNLSTKQIVRLLRELSIEHDSIVQVEGRKRESYKLIKPLDVVIETFDKSQEIGWLFNMAHDADPEIFKEIEEFTKKDKHLYMFKNTPFEDINTIESKQSFQRLKRIIEAREYAKLKFIGEDKAHDNLKCLKLVFIDSNWYVAFVDREEKLRFGRISFIERVDYATKTEHFQPSLVAKQMKFLESVQNSMTLYGEEKKTATIKATGFVAKYFEEGMKIFLSSQKFKEKLDDGSIIFTLEYTQELEILPFIQKWLPDIIILEPQELKDAYINKLQNCITNHS
ncbi:MAG: WYL domain-containing protein [Campylobacterota bacterium]|nr:WYL domain-containing protein [Campylobacterota bacterium]